MPHAGVKDRVDSWGARKSTPPQALERMIIVRSPEATGDLIPLRAHIETAFHRLADEETRRAAFEDRGAKLLALARRHGSGVAIFLFPGRR